MGHKKIIESKKGNKFLVIRIKRDGKITFT